MRTAAMDDYFFNEIKSHPRVCGYWRIASLQREMVPEGKEVVRHVASRVTE